MNTPLFSPNPFHSPLHILPQRRCVHVAPLYTSCRPFRNNELPVFVRRALSIKLIFPCTWVAPEGGGEREERGRRGRAIGSTGGWFREVPPSLSLFFPRRMGDIPLSKANWLFSPPPSMWKCLAISTSLAVAVCQYRYSAEQHANSSLSSLMLSPAALLSVSRPRSCTRSRTLSLSLPICLFLFLFRFLFILLSLPPSPSLTPSPSPFLSSSSSLFPSPSLLSFSLSFPFHFSLVPLPSFPPLHLLLSLSLSSQY